MIGIPFNDEWYCIIKIDLLNPKNVPKSELYMVNDEITQKWEVTKVVRTMKEAEEEKNQKAINKRFLIIFDGPVKETWIEDIK